MTTSHPPEMPAHRLQPLAATDPALVVLLRAWLPERRWFPAKGEDAEITSVGTLALVDPAGPSRVQIVLLRARTASQDVVLQVPVVLRELQEQAEAETAIGVIGDPPLQVYDGCGEPAFLRAWLAVASGPGPGSPTGLALDTGRARVLTGEQSNTSVVLPGPEGGAILKIFRALSPGLNPDVEIPRALAAQGWWHVPPALGWLVAEWLDNGEVVSGHLAVLSRFVPGAADGFELACQMAARGESFAPLAEDLGRVVAEMHAALRVALPAAAEEEVTAHAVADAVLTRFRWASGIVPSLMRFAGAVQEAAARAAAVLEVPPAQRIHGDLHLGQALRARDTWFLTDFEGEPLAPIAARAHPDLALRDVAGILRSFDYAAAVGGADEAWTLDAREALLRGYRRAAVTAAVDQGEVGSRGETPDETRSETRDGAHTDAPADARREDDLTLLRAVELERALYEAVYEARNRPTWTHIPAAALVRLLGPLGD